MEGWLAGGAVQPVLCKAECMLHFFLPHPTLHCAGLGPGRCASRSLLLGSSQL